MGQNNKPPHGSRRHAQMRLANTAAPSNIQTVAGFIYTDSSAVPDQMAQYSSATYSLSSPAIPGMQQYAVMLFSLGSVGIPDNLKRIAILPEQ